MNDHNTSESNESESSAAVQTVNVKLDGSRDYPIFIGRGVVASMAKTIRALMPDVDRLGVVTSETVHRLHGERLGRILKSLDKPIEWVVLPDGESHKTLASFKCILDVFLPAGFTRQSGIIALGGGVIGDIAGYAAASILRGVRYIQIPTTLLAMVDSSVGGKTGVNHETGKNLIGAFYQPKAVAIDLDYLNTLSVEEFRAGFAEVIKYGVIWDEDFFSFLENDIDAIFAKETMALMRVIEKSVRIKAEVVSKDEREGGLRAILNYGHTVGHAIEAATKYSKYRHGEAIAIGMAAAARLAWRLGLTRDDDETVADIVSQRIDALCLAAGLPIKITQDLSDDDLLTPMRKDKKVRDGKLRFVLPERLGSVRVVKDIQESDVSLAMNDVRE